MVGDRLVLGRQQEFAQDHGQLSEGGDQDRGITVGWGGEGHAGGGDDVLGHGVGQVQFDHGGDLHSVLTSAPYRLIWMASLSPAARRRSQRPSW